MTVISKINYIQFGNSTTSTTAVQKPVTEEKATAKTQESTKSDSKSSNALTIGLGAATLLGIVATLATKKKLGSAKTSLEKAITENSNLKNEAEKLKKESEKTSKDLVMALYHTTEELSRFKGLNTQKHEELTAVKAEIVNVFDSILKKNTPESQETILNYMKNEKNSAYIKKTILDHYYTKANDSYFSRLDNKEQDKSLNFLLRELLNSEDKKLQDRAIDTLTKTAEEQDLSIFKPFLTDKSIEWTNKASIASLYERNFSKERFSNDILPILKDMDEDVYFEFFCHCKNNPDKEYLPFLKELKPEKQLTINYLNEVIAHIENPPAVV